MRVACLGGGPAGLYFAICMKLHDPSHEIVVFEEAADGGAFDAVLIVRSSRTARPDSAKVPRRVYFRAKFKSI